MVERVGYIRNPLTVIGIFAAIAEVSGTVVLPRLDPQTQHIYVWFLMGFPCLLVILFFATLFRKHHVLYAPSDFRSDESFTTLFERASGTSRTYKLEEEVREVQAAEVEEANRIGADVGDKKEIWRKRDIRAAAVLAEELVIASLGKELGLRFERNVAFRSNPNVVFDAVARTKNRTIAVEVKYSRAGKLRREIIDSTLARIGSVYETLPRDVKQSFEAIFAVASDAGDASRHREIATDLQSATERLPFKTSARVYDLAALEERVEAEIGLLTGSSSDHFSRRIVGLLGSGRSMSLRELLSALGVSTEDRQAVADVQLAIGDLISSGRIEHDLASAEDYRLARK